MPTLRTAGRSAAAQWIIAVYLYTFTTFTTFTMFTTFTLFTAVPAGLTRRVVAVSYRAVPN